VTAFQYVALSVLFDSRRLASSPVQSPPLNQPASSFSSAETSISASAKHSPVSSPWPILGARRDPDLWDTWLPLFSPGRICEKSILPLEEEPLAGLTSDVDGPEGEGEAGRPERVAAEEERSGTEWGLSVT
jgi:hypothetical protein